MPTALNKKKDIHLTEVTKITDTNDRNVSDGRPQRAQVKFLLEQLPAVLRHIPTFLRKRSVKQVNPKKHYVWLFDNIAFRASSVDKDELSSTTPSLESSLDSENAFFRYLRLAQHDPWQVEYTAAFFKKKGNRELAEGVAHFCQSLDLNVDAVSEDKIRCRIQHFVDWVLPRHVIHTTFGHKVRHLHGPSSVSGLSSTLVNLPTSSTHKMPVANTFPGARLAECFLPGITAFAEPEGWGVISDIDDTIKVTMTSSSIGVLTTTFLEDARPVVGMPELYLSLFDSLSAPPFFYVSASPYNLYPYLRQFREDYYPFGPVMLRENTWQNLGGLYSNLIDDVQKYKSQRIRRIHSWFPSRKMILIGDSTHKDPETYAEMARAYPGWVRAIFIRKVTGVSEVANPKQEEKNSETRFRKAFEGLDEWMWFVFNDPEDVGAIVEQLVAQQEEF